MRLPRDTRTRLADILATFTALYGDSAGFLHVAAGADLHLKNGRPTHRRWDEKVYEYPSEVDRAARDIITAATTYDTYVCSCLMRGRTRAKGAAVVRTLPHADVDSQLDVERVQDVNGFAIASGTPGHAHVYVRVAEDLTVTEYDALCRGLVRYLGGDPGKISDNDFLRPAGTLNHKPVLTGGEPAPVTWLVRP
jgi:putative DNA primase/helicase